MNKIEGMIFDMDGTLYPLDRGRNSVFANSLFRKRIHNNAIRFFRSQFNLSESDAVAAYTDIITRFKGEVSLGVERELGVPRDKYFASTWDMDPEDFVEPQEGLVESLSALTINTGILSAAPRVWVNKVLDFLNVRQLFEPGIFTGDPDIRKPSPLAFQQIAEFWNLPPNAIISVGDQDETDILPAKSLGMLTVRIGRDVETKADFLAPDAISAIALLKKEGIII